MTGRGRSVDALLAIAIASAVALESVVSSHDSGPAWGNVALAASLAVPLALRRRAPLAAAAAVFALAAAQTAFLTPLPPLVTPLLLVIVPAYSVAAESSRLTRAALGLAICLAGGGVLELVAPGSQRSLAGIGPAAVIMLAAWGAGRVVAARVARIERLDAIAAELLATQRAHEQRAVAEQRAQIARELHDVVAHAMTVICLQAGAAQRVWTSHPEQAQQAVAAVGTAARDTLAHLRSSLGLLDPARPPALLGLEDVEALARGARAAGIDVRVRFEGRARALPGPICLVAYRIVQEALTNSIRHAAPTDVAVHVAFEPDALSLEVRDVGRRGGAERVVAVAGSGHGLRGMRERVEDCAGVLSFGPLPSGGFAVAARLPLEGGA